MGKPIGKLSPISKLYLAVNLLIAVLAVLSFGCSPPNKPAASHSVSPEPDKKSISRNTHTKFGAPVSDPSKEGFEHLWKFHTDPEFKLDHDDHGTMSLFQKLGSPPSWVLIDRIQTIKKGEKFYRWSEESFGHLVDAHDGLTSDYIDIKVNEISQNSHGGGIYLASNAFDSQRYGDSLTIMELEQDIKAVSSNALQRHFPQEIKNWKKVVDPKYGEHYNSIIRSLRLLGLGAIIVVAANHLNDRSDLKKPGVNLYDESLYSSEKWYNFFHPDALTLIKSSRIPWLEACGHPIIDFIRGEKANPSIFSHPGCDPAGVLIETLLTKNKDTNVMNAKPVHKIAELYPEIFKQAFVRAQHDLKDLSEEESAVLLKKAELVGIDLDNQTHTDPDTHSRHPSSVKMKKPELERKKAHNESSSKARK